jgi:hypothetical protein
VEAVIAMLGPVGMIAMLGPVGMIARPEAKVEVTGVENKRSPNIALARTDQRDLIGTGIDPTQIRKIKVHSTTNGVARVKTTRRLLN